MHAGCSASQSEGSAMNENPRTNIKDQLVPSACKTKRIYGAPRLCDLDIVNNTAGKLTAAYEQGPHYSIGPGS
jgi:hypothetical protein